MHGLQQAVPPKLSPLHRWTAALTLLFPPYQLNPLNLNPLRDSVKARARAWLDEHFAQVGQRSTVDIRAGFL